MAVKTKTVFGSEVYDAYVSGEYPEGKNYSSPRDTVYFYGDTIYSYGYHFPMATRMREKDGGVWYLVNGDSYSVTTAKHQSDLRYALRGCTTVIIPFSAIEAANIRKDSIKLVDQEPERYLPYQYKDRTTGELREGKQHLMGSSVIKAEFWTGGGGNEFYFLSGLDDTGREPHRSFFLAQLPMAVETVTEGYDALKPQVVIEAENLGEEVLRQGEWFFIRVSDKMSEFFNQTEKKEGRVTKNDCLVNRDSNRPLRHKATRILTVGDGVFVRGTVRHTEGDHKMLKLEKGKWYMAVENTQLAGWGASGRID